ncbi:hypothetical protein H2248_007130 [Termitomyces sp. 'cryptogamus']|nr:hypothetical protein H2248_007130 [Termitomyces sp. 'cryptogamus']
MTEPLLDDHDNVLRDDSLASTVREISGLDAEKERSHGVTSSTSTSFPRGLMVCAREGHPDNPRLAQDPAMSGLGHSLPSDPSLYSRPVTTRHMQSSPSSNSAFTNAQNPRYPVISSSSLHDQRSDFRQFLQQPININVEHLPSFTYPHSYHLPDIPDSNTMGRNVHAHYQTTVQPPQTFHFNRHPHEGPPGAPHPFVNAGTYSHARSPPHQSSLPHLPGGYVFRSANYSPSNSVPPYGYPPPQGYSPPMYSPYSVSPYNQSRSPEVGRHRAWCYSLHHPAVQFDDTVGYQNNVSGSRPIHSHINPYYTSASSPHMSLPVSPISTRLSSPEQRLNQGTDSTPGSGVRGGNKPLVRRPYHPNPPVHRSEWVMWAGNVPSDATHDMLWRFFTKFPEGTPDVPAKSGVLSIFLISRSSCAFVNYEEEHYLNAAIKHFNGRPLRPGDPRCPKLVCRIRKKDDDLRAGVGGQRGIGMHIRWIKEQKARAAEKRVSPTTEPLDLDDMSTDVLPEISSLSISSDDDPGARRRPQSLASSSSFASSNSGFLSRFFPQRYFILKSLTQSDLDLSKDRGLWATQKHNEGILDQAFRTSQDVYLIFSVNKSGEFYGYARMAGPIRRGGHKVSWALRGSESVSSGPSLSPSTRRGDDKGISPDAPTKNSQGNLFFSPDANRLVDESPLFMTGDDLKQEAGLTRFALPTEDVQSAPAELGVVHQKMTMQNPSARLSLDHMVVPSIRDVPEKFELDPLAPVRAIRSGPGDSHASTLEVVAEEMEKGGDDVMSDAQEGAEGKGSTKKGEERDGWGEPFKIEWLSTERISFQKTRQIRNPWNHDREVKVSRDGTELEPGVGRKLIEDWALLAGKQ